MLLIVFTLLYDVSINAAGDQVKEKRRKLIALAVRSDAAAVSEDLGKVGGEVMVQP